MRHAPSTAGQPWAASKRVPGAARGCRCTTPHYSRGRRIRTRPAISYTKSEVIPFTTESDAFILLTRDAITRVRSIRSCNFWCNIESTPNPRPSTHVPETTAPMREAENTSLSQKMPSDLEVFCPVCPVPGSRYHRKAKLDYPGNNQGWLEGKL